MAEDLRERIARAIEAEAARLKANEGPGAPSVGVFYLRWAAKLVREAPAQGPVARDGDRAVGDVGGPGGITWEAYNR